MFGILLAIAIAFGWSGKAHAEQPPRRVLILSGFNYTFPAATQAINGIEKRLSEGSQQKFVIDAEFLDLVRVADPGHETRTATFVREKYASKPPDVVIAVGTAALQFIQKHRDIISPEIPLFLPASRRKAILPDSLPRRPPGFSSSWIWNEPSRWPGGFSPVRDSFL